MGRRTRELPHEAQGRVDKSLNGEQQLASDNADNQLYVQAYQAILARELLMNDWNEQDQKYF